MHIHVIKDNDDAKFWLEPIEIYANNFKQQYKQHIGKRIND